MAEVCPLHDQAVGSIAEIHNDVKIILAKMATFEAVVAVQKSELARMEKDVDDIWEELRKRDDKLAVRLDKIEALIEQVKGATKTIRILWLLFGAAIVGWILTLINR